MKKILSLLLLSVLIISCKTAANKDSKTSASTSGTSQDDLNFYFKATGNEPFWGVKIGNDQIVFTSLITGKESITFPAVDAIRAMDANVKMYKSSNETASILITIQQLDCQDSMSGAISPYSVKVEIKNNAELEFQKLSGCGIYNRLSPSRYLGFRRIKRL